MRNFDTPRSQRNPTARRIMKHLPNTSIKLSEILKVGQGSVNDALRILRAEKLIRIGGWESSLGTSGRLKRVYHEGKKRDVKEPTDSERRKTVQGTYYTRNKVRLQQGLLDWRAKPENHAKHSARCATYRAENSTAINVRARKRAADRKLTLVSAPKTNWVNNSIAQLHKIR